MQQEIKKISEHEYRYSRQRLTQWLQAQSSEVHGVVQCLPLYHRVPSDVAADSVQSGHMNRDQHLCDAFMGGQGRRGPHVLEMI